MSPGEHGGVTYVGRRGEPTTLPAILRDRAELTPDANFVTFQGTTISYGGMQDRAERAAAALGALGVARGDSVALMLPNCLEFLDLWFGCALIGAVMVPINTGLVGDGLAYIVRHSEAEVLLADDTSVATVDAALAGGPAPAQRFARGTPQAEGWSSLADLLAGGHARPRLVESAPGDIASLLYTSGTTGLPKGVMNCHNAYAFAGYEFTQGHVRMRRDDVLYTSLPLFHVNAQMLTTVGSFVSGRPMVLAPRFSASRYWDEVRRHGATIVNYIGAMLTMLAKQSPREDDAHGPTRLAIGGAAPAELWPAFEARFGLQILEIYGLTETATFCLGSPPDDIRVGKLGRPVRWAEVRIESAPGVEAARGEPGEIVIRSREPDVLFRGYLKQKAETATAMGGGWFHSGDRGVQDEDGYFRFLDRTKDVIRRRGENISSYEIERALNEHPHVAESAAIGVPSELGEADVLVVVVPASGAVPAPADLATHCAERLARFMVPRYVRFRDALPKTATQRVQKYLLREEGIGDAWDREAA